MNNPRYRAEPPAETPRSLHSSPARRVYLDYNATSPVRPEVRGAVAEFFEPGPEAIFGNASSVHWAGRTARKALEEARHRTALRLKRRPSDVIFTSGASEANNLALLGILLGQSSKAENKRIIVSAVEHPAVLATARRLERFGVEVVLGRVDPEGRLDLEFLEEKLKEKTALVSVMAVNNETGIISPISEVVRLAQAAGALVHVDAVQAVGRIPLPLEADLLSLSGHKIGGLKGAGVLAIREGLRLDPLIVGGPQERGHRAGTENVGAIASLAKALEIACSERDAEMTRLSGLQAQLESFLRNLPGVRIVGTKTQRVAQTTTALFEGVEGDSILQALDLEGVAASSGSACSSGSLEPSHVLTAMGIRGEDALASVRFSMGWATTAADLQALIQVLPTLLDRLRQTSGSVGSLSDCREGTAKV